MAIATPETWVRINSHTHLYTDVAQRSYLDFLSLVAYLDQIDPQDIDSRDDVGHQCDIASVQTILFAAMAFEAAIYDYSASRRPIRARPS